MGVAAYNRGSRVLAQQADAALAVPNARADRQAHAEELAELRAEVAKLQHDLRRACRCLKAERYGREQLRLRLSAAERSYAFVVGIFCRERAK